MRLHCCLGHPSLNSLEIQLRGADGLLYDNKTVKSSGKIWIDSRICAELAYTHRLFKYTVGSQGLRFYQRVEMNTTFVNGSPIIYVVDEVTHFCSFSILCN